jgi:hypothetical protein
MESVKEGEGGGCSSYENRTMKPVEIGLSEGRGMRDNGGRDEPNQVTL